MPSPAGGYTGAAYEGIGLLPWIGRKLTFVLQPLFGFSSPEAIILFGGLTKSGHWIKDPVEKAMNENVLPLWRDKVAVLFSDLKEADAAVLGASALAWGD